MAVASEEAKLSSLRPALNLVAVAALAVAAQVDAALVVAAQVDAALVAVV